jgi:HPr kinase/phosphorylase
LGWLMQKNKPKISVADFVQKIGAEIQIEILAGIKAAHKCSIVSARIQKLGLALAGFAHYIHSGRVQIVGQSEISYLFQLEPKKRIQAIRNLDLEKICCVLITKNLEPPPELTEISDEVGLRLSSRGPRAAENTARSTRRDVRNRSLDSRRIGYR